MLLHSPDVAQCTGYSRTPILPGKNVSLVSTVLPRAGESPAGAFGPDCFNFAGCKEVLRLVADDALQKEAQVSKANCR
jgi:hypothetical protein